MKKLAAVLTLLIAGCASAPRVDQATLAREQAPVVCGDKAQCDKYWQAAQAWIATHSGYKIQMASDAVIQTYGPQMYDAAVAYTVTKEAGPYGTTTLNVRAVCGIPGNCPGLVVPAVADFKDYLLAQ